MSGAEVLTAVAGLFVVGMAWLRTRMHYRASGRGGPRLSDTGVVYFTALAVLLACGWFGAPWLARRAASATAVATPLARVVWFLAVYYLFIPVHRALRARGMAVFEPRA